MKDGSEKNDAIILVASVACSKFGVNRPNQTKVIERKVNFYFSNSDLDLDHIHLGSNPKLRLDIGHLYSNFGVNRPKQTKVNERKPQFDAIRDTPARPTTRPTARPPFANLISRIFVENLVNQMHARG